ncbi:MAG: hypothetical protein AAF678_03375 [Pseudomonadota bacterium]
MDLRDLAGLAAMAVVFTVLVSGPVRRNTGWAATVTPLASIIGSGFLVSVPLLASQIGIWSVLAVACLCAFAYLVGGAIRFNIQNAEPRLETPDAHPDLAPLEAMSHLALIGAYFISVAYYLVLLATFGLKLFGITDPVVVQGVATLFVGAICGFGMLKGLAGVEKAEEVTVSVNLAAIAGLLVALFLFGLNLPEPYSWSAAAQESHDFDWETFRFLLGLLIIVQGFETTRFMGALYSGRERVAAMRRAQIIAAIVYLVFFILMIPLFPYFTSSADVSGFIDVIGRVAPLLPFIVTAGAVASQFSAAVADSIGASGLLGSSGRLHAAPKHAYALIGAVAVMVIWATDVVSIVALASRAFALFYALQCVLAAVLARQMGLSGRSLYYAGLALICFLVAVLGLPSE